MPKRNHSRNFTSNRFNNGQRTYRYITGSFKERTIAGNIITASSTVSAGNSRSVARDRAGAKKFVHSRRRRADRDYLKTL